VGGQTTQLSPPFADQVGHILFMLFGHFYQRVNLVVMGTTLEASVSTIPVRRSSFSSVVILIE
jgi:hypothetical protein